MHTDPCTTDKNLYRNDSPSFVRYWKEPGGGRLELYKTSSGFEIVVVRGAGKESVLVKEKQGPWKTIRGIPTGFHLFELHEIKIFFQRTYVKITPQSDENPIVTVFQQGLGGIIDDPIDLQIVQASNNTFEYDGLTYRPKKTLGDGSCALHGLLGEEINGVYRFAGSEEDSWLRAKSFFTDELRKKISKEGDPQVLEIFYGVITDYASNSEGDESAKMLFAEASGGKAIWNRWIQLEKQYENQIQDGYRQEAEFWQLLLSNGRSSLAAQVLVNAKQKNAFKDKTEEEIQRTLAEEPDRLATIISEDRDSLLNFLEVEERSQAKKLRNHVVQLLEELKNEKKKLITSKKFIKHYISTVANQNFYLNTNEIKLAAQLFNKNVLIVAGGDRLAISEKVKAGDQAELVVIYHEGNHFSRCEIADGSPLLLSPNLKKSSFSSSPLASPNLPLSCSPSSLFKGQEIGKNSPATNARKTNDSAFQQWIEQLHQLANFPESTNSEKIALLSSQLEETLQREPCFQLEQYQIRTLQIRAALSTAEQVPATEELCAALRQQLTYAEYAAKTLCQNSTTPLEDSLWQLQERILRLPSLEPDFFGAAVATLNEKLSSTIQDDALIVEIKALLPRLLPPAHYLWDRTSPLQELLEKLEALKELTLALVERLKDFTEGYRQNFHAPLNRIYEIYQRFVEEFNKASNEEKEILRTPKAQLSGIGLGFFLLDREVALDLLSLNAEGKICKKNLQGVHPVCHKEGVFYKPNSIRDFYINPGIEFAIYAFYQLLGCQETAPTALLKIRHLFLDGQPDPYGSTLQAGYGVEGILLQDFLGITAIFPFLERCLGSEQAQMVLEWLLKDGWQKEYLENNPELAPEKLSELGREELVERLNKAFEDLFDCKPKKPKNMRCFEFSDRAADHDKIELFKQPVGLLVSVLALLKQYPNLTLITHKAGVRQVTVIELVELCSSVEKFKQHFPTLSSQQLSKEILQLMSRFDRTNFSTHFIASLLTNPSDHKSDNFMVTFDRDQKGGVRYLSLVGIDNDQALGPSETSLKTILYLLEQMHVPFDRTAARRLSKVFPEELILDWLVVLEEQNQSYDRWKKQGVLTEEDLFEGEKLVLQIPLTLHNDTVPNLYAKAQKLAKDLHLFPDSTHGQLFEAVQPQLAEIYQKASKAGNSIREAYDTLRELLEKEQQPPSSSTKQSPAKAAELFLNSLKLDSLSPELQVSILGKAQRTFPSLPYGTTRLPGDPANPSSRATFLLLAVEQGYHALVARLLEEEKKSRLGMQEQESLSLVQLKNREGETALLVACRRLNLEMVQLLLQYGADAGAVDQQGKNALLFCLARFAEMPVQAAAIIHFLIEHSAVLLNAADEPRGWTCLHRLVEIAHAAPEEAPIIAHSIGAIVTYLIRKGANPDLANQQGLTALDYAMQGNQKCVNHQRKTMPDHMIQKSHIRLTHQLIRLGAGRTLNVQIAKDFFAQHPADEIYALLQTNSLPMRWQLALDALRNLEGAASQTLLEGVQLGKISLSQDLEKQLLDEKGDIRHNNLYGRGNVNSITLSDRCTLFFKQFPEMPGVEYAINKFFELLINEGTSATDLAKITLPEGRSYPVLISLGIHGENLHDVLKDPLKTRQLERLDQLTFAKLLIASLLVNFEDAKPDNFILEVLPDGVHHLISIDNDHAFVPPLVKESGTIAQVKSMLSIKKGDTVVQVKCILYCLGLMLKPLHPSVKQHFLALHPERFLRRWLDLLAVQNERHCALFPYAERQELFKTTEQNPGMALTIPFKEGVITAIYQKLQHLQIALRDSAQLTGMGLLRLIIPELGLCYEKAFRAASTPLERFRSLTKTQYPSASDGRFDTMITTQQIFNSMDIPEKAAWEATAEGGPIQALRELKKLQEEIGTFDELAVIRNALQNGDLEPFEKLQLDVSKERVLNGIAGGLAGVNFKKMSPELQKKVLAAVLKANYRSLRLSGCTALDANALAQLLRNSPQLAFLELHDCSKVDQSLLDLLPGAGYLSHLRLISLPLPNKTSFPHMTLRHLQIVDCQRLQELTVSHTLKSLFLEECWNLSSCKAKLYEPSFFKSSELSKDIPKDLLLQSLRLKACGQLQPWWGMFREWLEASSTHQIQLEGVPLSPTKEQLALIIKAIIRQQEGVDMLYPALAYYQVSFREAFKLVVSHAESLEPLILLVQRYQATVKDLWNLYFLDRIWQDAHANLRKVLLYSFSSSLIAAAFDVASVESIDLTILGRINDLSCLHKEMRAILFACPRLRSVRLPPGAEDIVLQVLAQECLDLSLTQGRPSLSSVDLGRCERISGEGLLALVKGCPKLTSVDFESCRQLTETELLTMAQGCRDLLSINLKNCDQITNKGLKTLTQDCPKLSFVKLSCCVQIADTGLQALARGCPSLSSVNLRDCRHITDAALLALAQGCPSLSSVNLSGCEHITDATLQALAQSGLKLSSVNLRRCRQITDAGLRALAECPLSFIDLGSCEHITDSGLHALVRKRARISFVEKQAAAGLWALSQHYFGRSSASPSSCKQITDAGLEALAQSCPNLYSIKLNGCKQITDAGIEALVQKCPNLYSIKLNGCQQITDAGVEALAQYCPKLSSAGLRDCPKLTAISLQKCPNLSSIDLGWCQNITYAWLQALTQKCPSLSSIKLRGSQQSTAIGLQALVKECPNLSRIDLAYCKHVTDGDLQALAKGCPNLSSLNLAYCEQITDAGLESLAQGCLNLSSIKLSWCKQITDNGLQALAQGCPNLSLIDLRGCAHITHFGLQAMIQECPNLCSVTKQTPSAALLALAQRHFDIFPI